MCLTKFDSYSYISFGAIENSKLCSSWVEKYCVLVDCKEKMFDRTKAERKLFDW